jgi:hypothetical protein
MATWGVYGVPGPKRPRPLEKPSIPLITDEIADGILIRARTEEIAESEKTAVIKHFGTRLVEKGRSSDDSVYVGYIAAITKMLNREALDRAEVVAYHLGNTILQSGGRRSLRKKSRKSKGRKSQQSRRRSKR